MRFFENRFVWKDSPEAAPPEGGSTPSEDNDQEEPATDGTKVAPEDSGEAAIAAQAQLAASAEEDGQSAEEELSQQVAQLDTASGDSSGAGAVAGTGAAAGSAASVIPEDIIKEIQEKGPYKVAQEKLGAGPVLAGILTILYYMYKDDLFGDGTAGVEAQASIDQARGTLQQQYQTQVDALIAGGKLPAGIKVGETDPSLIDQIFHIKKTEDLDAYLTGKPVLTVPAGTSLFDYLDKLKSAPAPVPADTTADTGVVDVVGDDAGGDNAPSSPEPAADELSGPFKYAPTGTIDLTRGETAPFILHSGDRVELDLTRVRIGDKKFKIEVYKSAMGLGHWFDAQFNSVSPNPKGGFIVNMGQAGGGSEQDVSMNDSDTAALITALYSHKDASEFEYRTTNPANGEDVQFKFTAV